MTVEIVDQKWYLKFVEDEGVFVKTGDTRFKSKTGQLTEKIVKFIPSTKKKQMNLVTVSNEQWFIEKLNNYLLHDFWLVVSCYIPYFS